MNVKEIAIKAGIGENAIYRWKTSQPSADKLQAVADVLHVSYLIANHVDINYISKRLGHANTMITQKVYAHLLEDQRKEQVSQTLQALSRL